MELTIYNIGNANENKNAAFLNKQQCSAVMPSDRQPSLVICCQTLQHHCGGASENSGEPPEETAIFTPLVNTVSLFLFMHEWHPKHGCADLASSHRTPGGIHLPSLYLPYSASREM